MSRSQLKQMNRLTATQKHQILREYRVGVRGCGLKALAARYGIAGGARTLSRWISRWRGSPRSLENHKSPGRPRILTTREVEESVRKPILAGNRACEAVLYTKLLPKVRQQTGKEVKLKTLRHYGTAELGAKKRTKATSSLKPWQNYLIRNPPFPP